MGPEATVLHTRQISAGSWKLWKRSRIEVTAGLRHQSQESKSVDHSPKDHGRLTEHLADLGLPLRLAEDWLEQIQRWTQDYHQATVDKSDPSAILNDWLSSQIPLAEPIDVREGRRRIVTLVGATGVGKTTTIAKLAGQFCIEQKSRVGLLTVDAFRAAAVEQIEAFANALKIPLEVVRDVDQVQPALDRLSDVDLLLIDTVGQSPREAGRLNRLGKLLTEINPDETYLVLDANSSITAAADTLRSFASLRPSALILSKVDEVRSAATAIASVMQLNSKLNASRNSDRHNRLGFSYVTTGQSVPRDIELADAETLASLASGLALKPAGSVISSTEF